MVAGAVANLGLQNSGVTDLLRGRDTRWYKGHLAKLNLVLLLLLITSMTNGYDGSMMNGLQSLTEWQNFFDHPTGGKLGLFNAIQSIGGIAGLPFAPYLSDYLGRRMTIFIGSILMLIGVAIQTAAQNFSMFIGCRFLIGFGLSFACLAAPILITELAFPTHRAPITSLYNSSWYLGSIVAAWVTYGTFRIPNDWSWRIPSVLQGLPSVIQVLLIFLVVPESPRWLIDHGREEQATKIIAKYHCGGDMEDPLVSFEIEEIKEAIRMEKEANSSSSFKQLFATKGNRRRMRIIIAIAFFSQWSGNGIVSYYLNIALKGIGITSESSQTLFNGILQVYNYATAILGALVVDKAGRRTLFLTSTAGMTIVYAIWTGAAAAYAKSVDAGGVDALGNALRPNKNAGNTVAACIFFYYGFYNIALSPLLVSYTVEILPFRIRSKGLMIMNLAVNCSLVFNQYANPIALEHLAWKYYIVYTVWLAFEFVFLYFFIIETKGKDGPLPLEEISAIFDGPEVRQALADRTAADLAAGGTGGVEDIDAKYSGEDQQVEKAHTLHV